MSGLSRPTLGTYRCAVLPDASSAPCRRRAAACLNAPTGARCSLTLNQKAYWERELKSQCTYRCVVLPDLSSPQAAAQPASQCTYRCVVLPDLKPRRAAVAARKSLNAPTGAWCSLTHGTLVYCKDRIMSQCTYRCVVLPDREELEMTSVLRIVSMHLQVRGAP